MRYEAHITFNQGMNINLLGQLHDLADSLGGKLLLIDLEKSAHNADVKNMKHPNQLMFARKFDLHDDVEAASFAEYLVGRISNANIDGRIVRLKLEAQMGQAPAKYFEAHWKVGEDIYNSAPTGLLRSRSVFNRDTFYVTAREWNWEHAKKSFDKFKRMLEDNGYHDYEADHYERVLLDSDPTVDFGWDLHSNFTPKPPTKN